MNCLLLLLLLIINNCLTICFGGGVIIFFITNEKCYMLSLNKLCKIIQMISQFEIILKWRDLK